MKLKDERCFLTEEEFGEIILKNGKFLEEKEMKKENEIEDLIKKSLEEVHNLIENEGKSRLIIPNYAGKKNKKRCSEQELRFVFLENLLKNTNYKYSVETPTSKRYSFKDFTVGKGRSGCIDITVYENNQNPVCNIEFKYGQHNGKNDSNIYKDFFKLIFDNEMTNYFVHYIRNDKYEENSKETVLQSYKSAIDFIKKQNANDNNLSERLRQNFVYFMISYNGEKLIEKHSFYEINETRQNQK